MLNYLNIADKKINFLYKNRDDNFYLSCKNLKNINLYRVENVTIYQLMNCGMLVLDEAGLEYFNNLYKN